MEDNNSNNHLSSSENNSEKQETSQNPNGEERFIFLKWVKKIVATIGIIVGVLVLLLLAVTYLYEDEIKQYAINQLNKKLDVKVSVEDIEFTVFEQFPQASLKFHNTFINDKNSENELDTLFFSENIYFNFNFWSIIEGEYVVKHIKTENTFFNLRVDKKGNENYSILKEDTIQSDDKFSFALKKVDFNDLRINYLNDYNDQYYKLHTDEMTFSGDFSSSVYEMEAKSSLSIDQIKINQISYLNKKEADLSIKMEVNNDSSSFTIKEGDLNIADAGFKVRGTVIKDEVKNGSNVDIAISTNNLSITEAFSLLPEKYTNRLNEYQAKGFVWFDAKIKGLVSKTSEPDFNALFSVENGTMVEKTTQENLSNIKFNGKFSSQNKTNKSSLQLSDISASLSDGNISGAINIDDINNGRVRLDLNGDLGLNKIIRFVNIKEIGSSEGRLLVNTSLEIKNQPDQIVFTKTEGAVVIKDAALKFTKLPYSINEINGKTTLYKDNLQLSDFGFSIYEDHFNVNMTLKNIINHFSKGTPLLITGNLTNDHLDLKRLLGTSNTDNGVEEATNTTVLFPENIKMNIELSSNKLLFGKFDAKDLTGNIIYSDQKISVSKASFNANKGEYTITTSLEQLTDSEQETRYIWDADVKASQIDISDFFTSFDNFSQTILTDKNIKGKGSVNLAFSSLLLEGFSIVDSSIVAIADIDIDKGNLKNQSTMIELAEYLDENKLINKVVDTKQLANKMGNIKFESLSNSIKIENQVITIPRMSINTNVMDIELLGTHTFSDYIDYHFNFRLRDVLVKNKNQEEFGPVQDDGLGVKFFMHVYGNIDSLNYEFDKEEKKLSRKENIEAEKTNMKQILKDEFGLFKKDTTLSKQKETEKVKPEFQLSWDEFDEDSTSQEEVGSEDQKKKNKEEKKKKNKLLNKLGVKEEEEAKPKFEIEK